MKMLTRSLLIASALAMTSAMPAMAKTFVYCSEASPEGFDPSPYTAGGTGMPVSYTHLTLPTKRIV